MLTALVIALALAVAVAGEVYDVTLSTRGIKAGVAVEGNDWLVGINPSARALYLRDSILGVVFAIVPAVCVALAGTAAAYPILAGPVLFGLKHYSGGRKWAKMLNMTYEQRMAYCNRPLSAWQKFLDL
jgi:hypothetical protein